MCDSTNFVGKLKTLETGADDILVSVEWCRFLEWVRTSSGMGRSISRRPEPPGEVIWVPVVANFYTERFKEVSLISTSYKPKCCFLCVDDTFAVWIHGVEELQLFVDYLNSIYYKVCFMDKQAYLICA